MHIDKNVFIEMSAEDFHNIQREVDEVVKKYGLEIFDCTIQIAAIPKKEDSTPIVVLGMEFRPAGWRERGEINTTDLFFRYKGKSQD